MKEGYDLRLTRHSSYPSNSYCIEIATDHQGMSLVPFVNDDVAVAYLLDDGFSLVDVSDCSSDSSSAVTLDGRAVS